MQKALTVLRWLIDGGPGPWGVRQLAAELNMSPSTIHRILGTLQEQGLVRRYETGLYDLGIEFYRLAHLALAKYSPRAAALPQVQDLVARCNETAVFCVYRSETRQSMYLLLVESNHPLRYVIETGQWQPMYVGSTSLAIVASLPDEEREAVIADMASYEPLTEKAIRDVDELRKEIAVIGKRGYAITQGQRIPGAVGIASPVYGPGYVVVGAVGLTIPETRFERSKEPQLGSLVVECARAITRELAGDGEALESSLPATTMTARKSS